MSSPTPATPGTAIPFAPTARPPWASDRGDGTYRNPVLFADYSDPDAIRVGEDYWLTASSFSHVPGLPILHSRDLVNWSVVNYALLRLTPAEHFSVPRHGAGVWAPSLRFQAGRYWIFYPDPDFGLYVITANDPGGTWSDPVLVKAGRGLIDPCPFWDDDGVGYLIHGWARSRSGIKNRLTLHRLGADHLSLGDDGQVVIDGDAMTGWHTIEGPKLYKRNGYYYVFAPAGGVKDGYQAVFRSRDIRGPYESRVVLAQGRSPVNGPHQGAWVDTPTGENWFLHFQELPAFGRIVHLQPMRWENDWPVMGQPGVNGGPGEPVATFRKPVAAPTPSTLSERRERLSAIVPTPDWQWQANPQPEWFSVAADGDTWRLSCVPLPAGATLWGAGNLLMRKFAGPAFLASATLELIAAAEGDCAGLVVFGHDYAWLGLRRENGRGRLALHLCPAAHQGGAEKVIASADLGANLVHLCVSVDRHARCQFAYSRDRRNFSPIGPLFQATSSYWVGAKVGVFAAAADQTSGGHAAISRFTLHRFAEAADAVATGK